MHAFAYTCVCEGQMSVLGVSLCHLVLTQGLSPNLKFSIWTRLADLSSARARQSPPPLHRKCKHRPPHLTLIGSRDPLVLICLDTKCFPF